MYHMTLYKIDHHLKIQHIKDFDNSYLGFPQMTNVLLKKYHFKWSFKDVLDDFEILNILQHCIKTTYGLTKDNYDLITYLFLSGHMFRKKDLPIISNSLMKFLRNNDVENIGQNHIKPLYKEIIKLTTDNNCKAVMISMSSYNDSWYNAFNIHEFKNIKEDENLRFSIINDDGTCKDVTAQSFLEKIT